MCLHLLSSGLSALVSLAWKKKSALLAGVEAFINLAKASRLLDSRLFPTWFTPSSPPFQKKKVVGSRSLSGCLAAKHPFSTANADVYCARESAAQPVLVAGQTATPAALRRRV